MQDQVAGACAGLTVVELGTSMVTGPFCGQILGDLGADVIKIESASGDMMRMVPPIHNGTSGVFQQFNRNKRSIVLDLKDGGDREVALKIIQTADVLIENFRPGVTSRLGFDYQTVKELNDQIIYISINGFGADGPYAKLPAYDQVIQGMTGFMVQQGSIDDPQAIRSVIADKITGHSAATAALAALLHRQRGGTGQHVEVRMLDAYSSVMLPEFVGLHAFPGQSRAQGPSKAIYRSLRTQDGHVVGLIAQDYQFKAICRALDCNDLLENPRYATPAGRFSAMDEILDALERETSKMTTKQLLDLLWQDSNVAIGPVHSLESFLKDPQVEFNRTVFTDEHSELGPVRYIGPFAAFSETPISSFNCAPKLGEHSEEIRSEVGLN